MYVCELRVSVCVRAPLPCKFRGYGRALVTRVVRHELASETQTMLPRSELCVYYMRGKYEDYFFSSRNTRLEKVRSHACEHAMNVLVFKNLCREKRFFFFL